MGNKFTKSHKFFKRHLDHNKPCNNIQKRGIRIHFLSDPDSDLELFQPLTHFSPIELKLIRLYFNSCVCCDIGSLSKQGCVKLLFRRQFREGHFELSSDHEALINIVFNAMNESGSGHVSFQEFAMALSTAVHGTFQEKAQFSFRLMDWNRHGTIQKQDMKEYVRVLLSLDLLKTTGCCCCLTRGDMEEKEMENLMEITRDELSTSSTSASVDSSISDNIGYCSESGTYYNVFVPKNMYIDTTHTATSSSTDSGERASTRGSRASSTLSTSDDAVKYTLDDLDLLVDCFFCDEEEITFEEYVKKCRCDKYLYEGHGLFEYLFRPLFEPVSRFLAKSDRMEKIGELSVDGKIRRIEIRGGLIYHYKPLNNHLKKIIRVADIESLQTYDNPSDLDIRTKKETTKYVILNPSSDDLVDWILSIVIHRVEDLDNRYGSFASVRPTNFHPLIDGQETYAAMARAMVSAKKQIFIAGWCVNPFIYMIRDESETDLQQWRLDNILEMMANRGVKIYIIIWHELTIASMGLGTSQIQKYLTELHPNICCIQHPHGKIFQWTHHQKAIIIDQTIAFIGGLDIGNGRYDNCQHRLSDNVRLRTVWPGDDFTNDTLPRSHIIQTGSMKYKSRAMHDGLDRDLYPRLPWHDIHCIVTGDIARDVASNFIIRWNHHNKITKMIAEEGEKIYDVRLELDRSSNASAEDHLKTLYPMNNVRAQVVRSISTWSGSLHTERSIQTAYIDLIQKSSHYIYIENQYFMSHTDKSRKIENRIADAIIDRICRAIEENQVFSVKIILPMHHSGDIYDQSTHQVMKWQRNTIQGVLDTLNSRYPRVDCSRYISFYALATYGFINRVPHFSQVYVHSKLMLVDDKYAIIGSANINDRSMVGNHDSEIAVVIEDLDTSQNVYNGRIHRCGKSLKELRKRLFREHLGLLSEEGVKSFWDTISPHHQAALRDPLSEFNYTFSRNRANENTKIYERVFAHYPSRKHRTLADYKRDLDNHMISIKNRNTNYPADVHKTLSRIKGHLVNYPLDWLKHDSLSKDTKLRLVDDNIFF
jgi:phosphatidylserine/phosphatidylglycerophosphate/cardiolipin synthase-like enzyme